MLDAAVATYKKVEAMRHTGAVFFDRGIPDVICYMTMEHMPIPEALNRLAYESRYHQKVFILPPWKEIYETDQERKQSWEEACFTFGKMKETYLTYGYELIEVPKGSPESRVRFVLKAIAA